MDCPECRSSEISDAGICLVCGFRVRGGSFSGQPASMEAPLAPAGFSESEDASSEIPEWRIELSRRLMEIKMKRDSGDAPPPAAPPELAAAAPEPLPAVPLEAPAPAPKPAQPRKSRPRPERAPHAAEARVIPEKESPVPETPPPVQAPSVADPGPLPGTRLEAANVAIRPVRATPPPAPVTLPERVGAAELFRPGQPDSDTYAPLPANIPAVVGTREEPETDRFILLSRTLAGLVDFVVVVVCGSSFVFAVDVLEGVDVFDAVSMFHYGLLLLAVYFVYSLFFLGFADQTIGMMLTDLRVVTLGYSRPAMKNILIRCLTFLLGTAVLGVGLLWGIFDRRSQCLHDRFSGTQVRRMAMVADPR